jgi:choline dehydrogenase-like flavoprotein
MRTAIFTVRETTLTIQTSEALQLVPMSAPNKPIALSAGVNRKVVVGPGVFKVESVNAVGVTSDAGQFHAMVNADDKDGEWPDPQKVAAGVGVASATLKQFFATNAKGL